jgi:transglutaminase/protease-like cytokinesis protein 3
MIFRPFINRKLPSIRVPPIEPSQKLWITQQAVEHHMTQRTVNPEQRKSAQVLASVPIIGSSSIACCSFASPSTRVSTINRAITHSLRVRMEIRVRTVFSSALIPAGQAPIKKKCTPMVAL